MKLLIKISISLFCLLIISSGAGYPAVVVAQESPLVLAFYYAWFDQNTWTSGQSVDVPATRYNSADPATIERHVAQAQSAGIDALVQSWYGPRVENNQTETNFRVLLDVAQAKGFKAAVDFEATGPFFANAADVTSALTTLLATHTQHPAYLRYRDKPVVFFWRQQRFSVDEWASIRNQVDPDRSSFWIAEGTDIEYQAVFDGHHLYSIAWADSPGSQINKWSNLVRNYAAENRVERLWIATAMPGYNDTNLPRDNAFTVPRHNGDYYRESWQSALSSNPDMVIITSFNEWLEGTQIEPSATYGNLYLDVTRELATALRGSPPAAPPPSELRLIPPSEQAQAQEPPVGPIIQTGSITNVRSGPGTTFEIVGRLAASRTISVTGRTKAGDWWQIEFVTGPDGWGWVAAEVVDFVGDASTVAVVDTPAAPAAVAEATTTSGQGNSSAPVDESKEDTTPVVNIPAGGVNIRTGPGLEFDLLGRLDEGTSAAVVAKSETGEWWQIEYEAGESGLAWVANAVVDFRGDPESVPLVAASDNSQPTAAPEPVITGSVEAINPVNVRSEPAVDGIILGGIYPGEAADVIAVSEDGEWWQIDFADAPNQPAWVAAEFVRFLGEKNNVPIFGIGTVTPTPGPTDTPTATPTPSPSATISAQQPTFAPTATSLYQATSAALLSTRGTPEPLTDELDIDTLATSGFSWTAIPWGVLSLLVIGGLVWFQITRRRR